MKHYLVIVHGCVEPELQPVESHEDGLRKMVASREEEDASFMLTVNEEGFPEIYSFSASEVEEVMNEDSD